MFGLTIFVDSSNTDKMDFCSFGANGPLNAFDMSSRSAADFDGSLHMVRSHIKVSSEVGFNQIISSLKGSIMGGAGRTKEGSKDWRHKPEVSLRLVVEARRVLDVDSPPFSSPSTARVGAVPVPVPAAPVDEDAAAVAVAASNAVGVVLSSCKISLAESGCEGVNPAVETTGLTPAARFPGTCAVVFST